MPKRKSHQIFGAAAGGGMALVKSTGQPTLGRVLEVAGGTVGGYCATRVPDIIEPSTHPRHRSLAHGVAPSLALGTFCFSNLDSWQASLRALSLHHAELRKKAETILSQLWHGLLELLFRFLSGVVAGAIAGYASHLALDMATPRSLPIIA